MINKNQIESILKINGVSSTSGDEVIRSVLLSARYNNDEVDTAIMVLRENVKTNKTRVEGLHKIFRTDEALMPEEISQLLGIDVDVESVSAINSKARSFSNAQLVAVWFLSVALALAGILAYMYLYKVGVFHPSMYLN